jgi:hypothetical protein
MCEIKLFQGILQPIQILDGRETIGLHVEFAEFVKVGKTVDLFNFVFPDAEF